MTDFIFKANSYGVDKYTRYHPNIKASLALELVSRWGMAAGTDNGETSTGHPRLRLLTTDELVDRAVESADKLVNSLHRLGWLEESPPPKWDTSEGAS